MYNLKNGINLSDNIKVPAFSIEYMYFFQEVHILYNVFNNIKTPNYLYT